MPWAGAEGEPGATPALLLFYTPRSKIETKYKLFLGLCLLKE